MMIMMIIIMIIIMIIKNKNYNNKNENNNITMYSHCFLTQFCTDDIYTYCKINTLILLFLCLNFPCRSHQKKQKIIIWWLLFILWLFFMFMLRTVPVHPPQTWKATAHTTFSMRPCNAAAGTACNSNNNIYNCYGFYSGSLFSTPEHEKKSRQVLFFIPYGYVCSGYIICRLNTKK